MNQEEEYVKIYVNDKIKTINNSNLYENRKKYLINIIKILYYQYTINTITYEELMEEIDNF